MNLEKIRNLFPHIEKGIIYFNHASIGPLTKLVIETVNDFLIERSVTNIKNYNTFLELHKSTKLLLAELFSAEPERFAWAENIANGINVLAQGISWEAGDEIILCDIEFPSNVYPFLNLKRKGVEVKFVRSKNGIIDETEIEAAVTSKTKLISISAVQFTSGYRADLEYIGKICKDKNIIFCVDSIQGAGVVEIDIPKMNIDFLAGSGQKWLMGLQGLGFIYVGKNLQNIIEQSYMGWNSVESAWELLNYDTKLKENADRYQTGTVNVLGIAVLNTNLKMFREIGFENIRKRILANTQTLISRLVEEGYDPVLKNVQPKNLSGIVTVSLPNVDRVVKEMAERNIFAEARDNKLRISPHFYNTDTEMDKFIEVLKQVAKTN